MFAVKAASATVTGVDFDKARFVALINKAVEQRVQMKPASKTAAAKR